MDIKHKLKLAYPSKIIIKIQCYKNKIARFDFFQVTFPCQITALPVQEVLVRFIQFITI